MAVYAAQVDSLDQNIGRILAKVKQSGQEDNTLILFLADNSGCHEEKIQGEKANVPAGPAGSFTSYGRNWPNASNTPFRMAKVKELQNLYQTWADRVGVVPPAQLQRQTRA